MKSLLLGLALVSGSALADSSKLSVPAFSGEIKLTDPNVTIKSIQVSATLQYCNFWGTSCAGGPQEKVEEAVSFAADQSTNLIRIDSKNELSVSANKPMNRFSSCKVVLNILGKDKTGNNYSGHVSLVFDNDKETCKSKEKNTDMIAEKFKVPVVVNLWRF